MGVLGTEHFDRDNLLAFDPAYRTGKKYPVKSGETVTRGQVVKLDGGKLSPAMTGDTPAFIMLEDVDASGGDAYGEYMVRGTALESGINYNSASADEFREKLRGVGIITE